MRRMVWVVGLLFAGISIGTPHALAQGDAGPARSAEEQAAARLFESALVEAFDSGKADAVAALYAPEAELVDEQGESHRGRKAIADLHAGFFGNYPGATLAVEVDSVRLIGNNLAILDGSATIRAKDHEAARSLVAAVAVRQGDAWQIASLQQQPHEPETSAHERLQSLAWLVGDWVSEGQEAIVRFSCRWSEDENFLLGTYTIRAGGEDGLTTSQRLGWDPIHQHVRSWLFDSDGGFGEAEWAADDSRWVVKSKTVLPDGRVGSATFHLIPSGPDKFVWRALDRVIDGAVQADSEVTIVRRPPQPK